MHQYLRQKKIAVKCAQTAAEREASSNVDKLGQQLQSAKSEVSSVKQELKQAQSSGEQHEANMHFFCIFMTLWSL